MYSLNYYFIQINFSLINCSSIVWEAFFNSLTSFKTDTSLDQVFGFTPLPVDNQSSSSSAQHLVGSPRCLSSISFFFAMEYSKKSAMVFQQYEVSGKTILRIHFMLGAKQSKERKQVTLHTQPSQLLGSTQVITPKIEKWNRRTKNKLTYHLQSQCS